MHENSNKNFDIRIDTTFFFSVRIPEISCDLTPRLNSNHIQKAAWLDLNNLEKLLTLPYSEISDQIETSDDFSFKTKYPLRDLQPGYPNTNVAGSTLVFKYVT
jgi:hypothetical protein